MTAGSTADEYTEGMGERIRWIRIQNNLGQEGLGAKLGVSRQSISGYETERLAPSRSVMHKMCRIYGADPAWVYYGTGERPTGFKEYPKQGALTPAQDSLITLIKEDAEFAINFQKKMWDQGFARIAAEISSESG